jgi:hypothetical protein
MHAPLSVVLVLPCAGSPEPLRQKKPDFGRHRALRPEQWRPREDIPERNGNRLRRLVDEMREVHRQRAEAALQDGKRAVIEARPTIRAMLAVA